MFYWLVCTKIADEPENVLIVQSRNILFWEVSVGAGFKVNGSSRFISWEAYTGSADKR